MASDAGGAMLADVVKLTVYANDSVREAINAEWRARSRPG
jgi:hypothetical protein